MKKLLLVIPLLCALTACLKDDVTLDGRKRVETKTITIVAEVPTRTSFADLKTNWVSGDVIGVLFKTSDGTVYQYPYTVTASTINGNYAEFTGSIIKNQSIVACYAYYPYSASAVVNNTILKVDVVQGKASAPSEHNFMEADAQTFSPAVTATDTYTPSLGFFFHPLMARIDFNLIYNSTIAADVFTGRTKQMIMRVYDGAETISLYPVLRGQTDIADADRSITAEYQSSNVSLLLDNISANSTSATVSTMIIPWNIAQSASFYFDIVVNGKTLYVVNKKLTNGFNFRQGTRTRIDVDLTSPETKVYDITSATVIGTGTLTDPYRVPTEAALQAVNTALQSSNCQGIHYIQIADITASSWTPTATNSFQGSYDGGGYDITVSSITPTSSGLAGLFASVGSGANISNVTVTGSTQSGVVTLNNAKCAGMLAGEVTGNATFNNCHATGNLTGTANGGTKTYGGLIGRMTGGNVFGSSSFNGTITISSSNNMDVVGGLVGDMNTTTAGGVIIKNCFASGSIIINTGSGNGYSLYVGGVAGKNTNGTIVNSYSSATISAGVKNTNVGGVVGWNASSGVLANCYSSATITATGGVSIKSGILSGKTDVATNIRSCYYFASQTASGDGKTIGTLTTDAAILSQLNSYVSADVTYTGLSKWTTISGVNSNKPVLLNNLPQ